MSLNAPGLPGSQASNDGDLMRMIQDMQRDIRELRAANPFAPMGMTPQANGVVFSGSVEIDGNLSVPNGSISNAALQNPAFFGQSSTTQTNFSLATTDATYAPGAIAVPAGYSQAIVTCNVSIGAINSTAAGDYVFCKAVINSTQANQMFAYAGPSGGSGWVGSTKTLILTGLSGGSISVSLLAHAQGGAWAANASNRAYVEATATFLR